MIVFDRTATGKVIRQLRKERKMSQQVFGRLANVARSHLAMIERGAKQPNFETVWRIANAFGIPPHELVKSIESEAKASMVKENYG